MKANYLFLLGVLLLFGLFSCGDDYNYYPKVQEELMILNNTDTLLVIDYGLQYDTANYYGQHNRDTVWSKTKTARPFPEHHGELWMGHSEFEQFTSKIKIYKILDKDTIFVAPSFYQSRTKWTNQLNRYSGGDLFHTYSTPSTIVNVNSLTISPEMFTK